MKQSKLTHLMTSLVPGLGNFANFGGLEKLFCAPDQSLNSTRRIFAFTGALCLGETLVLLDVVSQHMAYIVT